MPGRNSTVPCLVAAGQHAQQAARDPTWLSPSSFDLHCANHTDKLALALKASSFSLQFMFRPPSLEIQLC